MLSAVNSFSSATALTLLSAASQAAAPGTQSTNSKSGLPAVTGNTDDIFKAGNAIGKIVEIVAGMNKNNSPFTMDGAQRTDNAGGGYTETKAGQGTFGSDADSDAQALRDAEAAAVGTGPQADDARAYLKAAANGTIQKTDMSTMGVTSTMTIKKSYYADGSERGSTYSWNTQGMSDFIKKFTVTGDDGLLHDKATGKYAGISQSGTKFTYLVY